MGSNNIIYVLELTIENETKQFYVTQANVIPDEIKRVYDSNCEEYGRRLTMEEFLHELDQYGVELLEVKTKTASLKL